MDFQPSEIDLGSGTMGTNHLKSLHRRPAHLGFITILGGFQVHAYLDERILSSGFHRVLHLRD